MLNLICLNITMNNHNSKNPALELEGTPVQAATLLWNGAWYIRYPDKMGRAVRLKLKNRTRAGAYREAERRLPQDVIWVIA